jgi:hypothetical protein
VGGDHFQKKVLGRTPGKKRQGKKTALSSQDNVEKDSDSSEKTDD